MKNFPFYSMHSWHPLVWSTGTVFMCIYEQTFAFYVALNEIRYRQSYTANMHACIDGRTNKMDTHHLCANWLSARVRASVCHSSCFLLSPSIRHVGALFLRWISMSGQLYCDNIDFQWKHQTKSKYPIKSKTMAYTDTCKTHNGMSYDLTETQQPWKSLRRG